MSREGKSCKGICKNFKVKKTAGRGRYGSGQGRCQMCDVWMDFRDAHLKGGTPATIDSVGWFCNCCNYRIRQKPRNKVYKEKLRNQVSERQDMNAQIDTQNSKEQLKNQFDYEKINHVTVKENQGNKEFFEGIKNPEKSQEEDLYVHCNLIIEDYKKRTISKHNVELMEDMINAYLELGTLEKICQETGLDETRIRKDFRNLIRVPERLKELTLEDKLVADPILAPEIALYATDFFKWDQDEEKTEKVVKFANDLAELFRNTLDLRKEFFATKDDYN